MLPVGGQKPSPTVLCQSMMLLGIISNVGNFIKHATTTRGIGAPHKFFLDCSFEAGIAFPGQILSPTKHQLENHGSAYILKRMASVFGEIVCESKSGPHGGIVLDQCREALLKYFLATCKPTPRYHRRINQPKQLRHKSA